MRKIKIPAVGKENLDSDHPFVLAFVKRCIQCRFEIAERVNACVGLRFEFADVGATGRADEVVEYRRGKEIIKITQGVLPCPDNAN
ncbi:MAG: hypothetical protein BWY06_01155 [Candidatus Latescibacteria bacterium ADurb.Bin168]|nr:MAG: hypothetical protein BWY06_01155 [Candidatus Latescibacteria bacterium ADurb.Bin168]